MLATPSSLGPQTYQPPRFRVSSARGACKCANRSRASLRLCEPTRNFFNNKMERTHCWICKTELLLKTTAFEDGEFCYICDEYEPAHSHSWRSGCGVCPGRYLETLKLAEQQDIEAGRVPRSNLGNVKIPLDKFKDVI